MDTVAMLHDNAGVVTITIILSATVQVVAQDGLVVKHFQVLDNGAITMVWMRTPYFGERTMKQCIYYLSTSLKLNPFRARVLNALKASPSCNIYIDDDCIYKGCVEHHFRREEVRGRPLAQRMTRRRSRSPGREQVKRDRSRSPLCLRSPSPMDRRFRTHGQVSPVRQIRGRSRSPLQQQQRQSPRHIPLRPRGRSPVFDVSGVIYSQTNAAKTGIDIFRPSFLKHQSFPASPKKVLEKQHMLQCAEGVASSNAINFDPFVASRVPLGAMPAIAPQQETTKVVFSHSAANQGPISSEVSKAQDTEELYIEDPHFVLGIREGALEKEILDAYQRQMWEVELGRVADRNYTEASGSNNVWDQSVAHLRAAKKQLVGY
ncbi:hypothetical protein DSL72_001787 [Monilinia vaccinii-corymbosi]|uniref:Uncharacterized protein n=1 Tax=Monilinia vaccinii-corymbosi TaxID=61207 RepID=A0A8A3PAT4_9HELO|nr:hypothetical protein DSL72_001787 [Monilinia vaccinii-corymbosi]